MKPRQTCAVVLALCATVSAGAGEEAKPTVADPDKMEWKAAPPSLPPGQDRVILQGDPSKPGSEYTFRARMPDGYRVPPHWHSVDENVTVLKGMFMMGVGDKFDESAGMPLKVGTFATMPKKVNHFVWTKGETIIQVHGIGPYTVNYVNPDDDPRRKK
jgi:hypothetical protein